MSWYRGFLEEATLATSEASARQKRLDCSQCLRTKLDDGTAATPCCFSAAVGSGVSHIDTVAPLRAFPPARKDTY